MGDVTKGLMMAMVAQSTIQATSDLLETSQMLGGLAKAIMEEDAADYTASPEQLIEASARCIDTIELIVMAVKPDETPMEDWQRSDLANDLKEVRERLDGLRNSLLDIAKEQT